MILSEINIYPIKSLKGIELGEAAVEERGLRFDRRRMLVDENNKFLTQREFPKMATVAVALDGGGLTASCNGTGIQIGEPADEAANVTIWSSRVKALIYPDDVNEWFSEAIGTRCRLVLMPEETRRIVSPNYAVRKYVDTVSFADGYPFLLIGRATLDDLNSRLETPVPMNRFRPNFVVEGSGPFEEDSWKKIRIGETVFHVVKPSERCVITTVDQETGLKGKEPLTTLGEFRKFGNKLLFGQNLIAEKAGGVVRHGDAVEIIEAK